MYTQTAGSTSVTRRLSELSRYRHVTIIVLRLSYSLNHSFDDAQATPPVMGNASGKGDCKRNIRTARNSRFGHVLPV